MSNIIKLKHKPRILKTDYEFEPDIENEVNQQLEAEKQYKRELERQYNLGLNDGYKQAKELLESEYSSEMVKKSEEFYKILSSFEEKLFSYETAFNEIIANLSVQIAEKIINFQVENKTFIIETLKSSVKKIIGANEILIRLNPKDYELLTLENSVNQIESSFTKIKFEVNEKIDAGGCYIQSEIGNVDARIKTQLEEIEKTFISYLANLGNNDGIS
jgi:flagellar biosynthesis/type III secretory pathway protein FliH